MILRIHYSVGEFNDYYDLTGASIEEIIEMNQDEMKKRDIDPKDNNCWSEEIKD